MNEYRDIKVKYETENNNPIITKNKNKLKNKVKYETENNNPIITKNKNKLKNKVKLEKKENVYNYKIFSIIISVLFVCCVIYIMYVNVIHIKKIENELDMCESDRTSILYELFVCKQDLEFYDEMVVFVVNGENYYYKRDQMYEGGATKWIFNGYEIYTEEMAISLGYVPYSK